VNILEAKKIIVEKEKQTEIIPGVGPTGGDFGHDLTSSLAIKDFIAKYNVKALTQVKQLELVKSATLKTATTKEGTIATTNSVCESDAIGPHLHFDGQIFQLNTEQWNKFTETATAELGKKLAQTKNIPFEHFMAISKIISDTT